MLLQSTLKKKLETSLKNIFEGKVSIADPQIPPLPFMAKEVALELARAYDSWVTESSPVAGGLTMVTRGTPVLIATQLSLLPLMSGWSTGLILYWTATTWGNNPGFIPTNPTVPASLTGIAPEIAKLMIPGQGGQDISDTADKIATILHKYTAMLMVSATTVAAVTSPVPVI